MTFPTTTTRRPCQECGGEGTTETETAEFDTRAEQWYPRTARHLCTTCDGLGDEEITTCCICGDLEEECTCTEDDLEAWNTFETAA